MKHFTYLIHTHNPRHVSRPIQSTRLNCRTYATFNAPSQRCTRSHRTTSPIRRPLHDLDNKALHLPPSPTMSHPHSSDPTPCPHIIPTYIHTTSNHHAQPIGGLGKVLSPTLMGANLAHAIESNRTHNLKQRSLVQNYINYASHPNTYEHARAIITKELHQSEPRKQTGFLTPPDQPRIIPLATVTFNGRRTPHADSNDHSPLSTHTPT